MNENEMDARPDDPNGPWEARPSGAWAAPEPGASQQQGVTQQQGVPGPGTPQQPGVSPVGMVQPGVSEPGGSWSGAPQSGLQESGVPESGAPQAGASQSGAPQSGAQQQPGAAPYGAQPFGAQQVPGTPTASAWAPPQWAAPQQAGSYAPYSGATPPYAPSPAASAAETTPPGVTSAGAPAAEAATPAAKSHRGGRATLVTAGVAVVALVAGFGGGMLGSSMSASDSAGTAVISQSTNQTASSSTPSGNLGSVQDVAATVLPSVVSVVSLSSQAEGEGSGIVLTASGLILTNNHVIDGAQKLTVQFNDGTVANATVVGADPTDDLAVIKVSGVNGLIPAVLGSSATVEVGQQVVAVGSPLGLSSTVTTGIVSALNRPVRTESAETQQSQGTVLNAIQTDAAINPGNSGGPLVDMDGKVIGINSAIASMSSSYGGQAGSIGVGFAIPIDQAYRIAQEIINTGTASHAVLGANVTDHTEQGRGITTGAEIAAVTPDGGAAKAGIAAGDVVTKVDSIVIESADALVATIRSLEPGGTAQVTYLREGQSHTVTVTLGSSTD